MTENNREKWLEQAVYAIDTEVFSGELDSLNHKFQIAHARVKGKKQSECVQPGDVEDLLLADFFPTTIGIDWTLKDPIDILAAITYECPRAFMGITRRKEFYRTLEKYYFEKPYNDPHPSDILIEKLKKVNENLKKTVGEWPGKGVVFPSNENKKRKSNKIVYICPECKFELYTMRKYIKEGYEEYTPKCSCGCQMQKTEENQVDPAGDGNVQTE